MKQYVYVIILVAVAVGLLVMINIEKEPYIMTLGGYGKPEPKVCDQTSPAIRLSPPSQDRLYVACNACSLACPDPSNCYECQQKLNLAGVL